MNRRQFIASTIAAAALMPSLHAAGDKETPCYEFRIYTAAEGKLDALHARFREHTMKIFEKHGMKNIGYWVPVDNKENKLYYLLLHKSRAAKDASWKAFGSDPEWKKVAAETEKNGRIVTKVESILLHITDFTPEVKVEAKDPARTFELRVYTCTPNNLPRLQDRFRNHTVKLFEKHGMTNYGYWLLDDDQPAAADTLFYLLAHKSKEAAAASFDAFRKDPDWVKAKEASEKAAGGSLTVPDGVKSTFLTPTDYSPTR